MPRFIAVTRVQGGNRIPTVLAVSDIVAIALAPSGDTLLTVNGMGEFTVVEKLTAVQRKIQGKTAA